MDKLLIIGAGDIAKRALPALLERYQVFALVRRADALTGAASAGLRTVNGDLDDPASLESLAGHADRIVHLAPPPDSGVIDSRTRNLVAALRTNARARGAMLAQPVPVSERPARLVYVSTTGVYGDCGGAYVDESRPVNPGTDRARRRVDAEQTLLAFGRQHGVNVSILRVPGIYAIDRLPIDRVRRGTPVLVDAEDVYTNHIHADDLAAIVVAALEHGTAGAVYNAADDTELKMGAWFDLIADRAGLPRPARIARAQARTRIPAPLLSFMSESRRIVNTKMKQALHVALRYPTVHQGLPARLSIDRPQSPPSR